MAPNGRSRDVVQQGRVQQSRLVIEPASKSRFIHVSQNLARGKSSRRATKPAPPHEPEPCASGPILAVPIGSKIKHPRWPQGASIHFSQRHQAPF
jgi:hypothetical protein